MPGPTRVLELEAPIGRWQLASAAPNEDLAGIVVEFWEVIGALAPFREKIIPNGCLEVMIDLGPPHMLIRDGIRTIWDRAWFSGLHERAIEIQSENGTHLVSARLTPLGAYQLFGDAAPAAANRVIDLEAFVGPAASELRQKLLALTAPDARFSVLEEFLLVYLRQSTSCTTFVTAGASLIEQAHGKVKVSELQHSLGVSRKHFSVTFTREVGIPPKAYAQLQRFRWTLARLRENEVVDWAQLAMDAGYADQSHLVRDFRRVADATPTEYLLKRTPDTSALVDDPS